MTLLKNYLTKEEIKKIAIKMDMGIETIENCEDFIIEDTFHDLLENLYEDNFSQLEEDYNIDEEEFFKNVDCAFICKVGYVLITK